MIDRRPRCPPLHGSIGRVGHGAIRSSGWLTLLVILCVACGIDRETFTPAVDANDLVGEVRLEYHTYNLATDAPYDTVQLRATVRSGTGQFMDEPVIYSVANTKVLTVSPTGQLRAVASGRTFVRASVTRHGGTRTDSAEVNVIDGTPTAFLAQLAIVPYPGDSAKDGAGGRGKILQLVRTDSSGETMSTLRVSMWSSDTLVAKIKLLGVNASVTPMRPGRVMLHVSTFAYGTSLQDSLPFIVGWPVSSYVALNTAFSLDLKKDILDFSPGRIVVGLGACVTWVNGSRDLDVDVTFEDPSMIGPPCDLHGGDMSDQGNILPFRWKTDTLGNPIGLPYRARSFPKAGVYPYQSSLWGTRGTIVVCDEKHDLSCAPENYQWGITTQ